MMPSLSCATGREPSRPALTHSGGQAPEVERTASHDLRHLGAVRALETELRLNPECHAGPMLGDRIFAVESGPAGGPELVALVRADEARPDRVWYGHVARHPAGHAFVSLLAWSTKPVSLSDEADPFETYRHWMVVDPHYEPCAVQDPFDAYSESGTFEEGVAALVEMIRRFDLERRCGYEDGPYASSPSEMRILGVYGLMGRTHTACAEPDLRRSVSAKPELVQQISS